MREDNSNSAKEGVASGWRGDVMGGFPVGNAQDIGASPRQLKGRRRCSPTERGFPGAPIQALACQKAKTWMAGTNPAGISSRRRRFLLGLAIGLLTGIE